MRDLISGTTDEQDAVVAPGKSTSSKAKLDAKGIADFFMMSASWTRKGSYYHCLAFQGTGQETRD